MVYPGVRVKRCSKPCAMLGLRASEFIGLGKATASARLFLRFAVARVKDRVFEGMVVVVATASDFAETVLFIESAGGLIRFPHLQQNPGDALLCLLDERAHQPIGYSLAQRAHFYHHVFDFPLTRQRVSAYKTANPAGSFGHQDQSGLYEFFVFFQRPVGGARGLLFESEDRRQIVERGGADGGGHGFRVSASRKSRRRSGEYSWRRAPRVTPSRRVRGATNRGGRSLGCRDS